MSPLENKQFFTKLFERNKNKPSTWGFTAWDLRAASEVLFETYRHNRDEDGAPLNPEHERLEMPATMLFGFAVEDLTKGVLIKKHGDFDTAKREVNSLKSQAWSHDLQTLVIATGYQLSQDQKLWLETLTQAIKWAGRYPTSLRSDEYTLEKQHGAADYMTPSALNSEGISILEPFIKWMEDYIFGNPAKALDVPIDSW